MDLKSQKSFQKFILDFLKMHSQLIFHYDQHHFSKIRIQINHKHIFFLLKLILKLINYSQIKLHKLQIHYRIIYMMNSNLICLVMDDR